MTRSRGIRTLGSSSFLMVAAFFATVSAQQVVPRFEPGECPFAPGPWVTEVRLECGRLVVYQIRERPEAGTLRLAVAILHPLTPSPGTPIVLPHGGPSGPGGLRGGELGTAALLAPIVRRDVVVYDQRGVGASEPQPLCPANTEFARRARTAPNREAREQAWDAGRRACAASLKARGLDPAMFSTPINALDLIDLRHALGYNQWDVLGVSYGSRLAQEVMRRDPHGVRSAGLDSPVQPGPGQEAESPLAFQRVLDHIFAACAAQPACAAAFPTLAQDFAAVYDSLTAAPLDIVFATAGESSTVRVDGERFLRALHGRFGQLLSRVPLVIHDLRYGDRTRAARVLLGNVAVTPGDNTLTDLVGCYESGGFAAYHPVLASVDSQLRPPFRVLLNTEEDCSILQPRFATADERAFVHSDIPTLIVTKEFDDRTPTDYGRRVAAGLTHAYQFEMRGLAHGQKSECELTLVVSFLADPSRAPDASCLTTMPPLVFETENLDLTTLVLVIRSGDGPPSRFAGRWEAAYPNAPVVYRVDLTVSGHDVTGVINAAAQALPIFDGRCDNALITFKVKAAGGQRTVTFTGRLIDDVIGFTRSVEVAPGGSPGGAALFGVSGAGTFVARRASDQPGGGP